jgi:hypothetical protein
MFWPLFFSLASLVFWFFSFLYLKAYIARRTSQEEILSDIRDEVNRLLLRIDEITDKDISLLEDREKRLKALLEETDKRLKVYTKELEKSATVRKTYQELGNSLRKSPPPVQTPVVQHGQPREEQKEAAPAPSPQSSGEILDEKAAPETVNEQIRNLALAGFSTPVIASRLGISISEVELAIALLERKSLSEGL